MINYDPIAGHLQRTAGPLNRKHPTQWRGRRVTPLGIVKELVAPEALPTHQPQLFYNDHCSDLSLAHLLATSVPNGPPPCYVYPGIGLLPYDPDTLQQYIPGPPNMGMVEAWGDRELCVYTGRVQHQKSSENVQFKLQHVNPATGRNTLTTVYRAKVVAAAALGMHPLTPVMAWYISDPELDGYGIDNIFTPTHAGIFRYSKYAPPTQPHEVQSDLLDTLKTHRPRYVYTPHAQLNPSDWPWPQPPTLISDML